jgi:carbonic anhydrase
MFSEMKLGTKIGGGFGILILIAGILGGVAVTRMHSVGETSTQLAEEYVPEVEVANKINCAYSSAAYEMRGYSLSQDEAYLDRGRAALAQVKTSLDEAEQLAESSEHLVKLRSEIAGIHEHVDEYLQLVNATADRVHAMEGDHEKLDAAAGAYVSNCAAFLADQQRSMREELTGSQSGAGGAHAGAAHGSSPAAPTTGKPVQAAPCPRGDQVIQSLSSGNARYVSGTLSQQNLKGNRRVQTATHGQKPQATILACSDSRVPVESIFDQGVGDVFPIRVAGNVCSVDELASIEYGVEHLETPLLVVMGHTGCGAVTAAVQDAEVHGSIPALLAQLEPAVQRTIDAGGHQHPKELVNACVKENVWYSIEQVLTRSKGVQQRAKAGQVKVVGAVYNLAEGTVEWLGPHPRQAALLGTPVQEVHFAQAAHQGSGDADSAAQLERLQKINLATDVINLGNATRIACFKSQAMRDPELIRGAMENFPKRSPPDWMRSGRSPTRKSIWKRLITSKRPPTNTSGR